MSAQTPAAKPDADNNPAPRGSKIGVLFSRFACAAGGLASRASAFAAACLFITVWLMLGPMFGWDMKWQLIINTGTTIVTFLMIFLLQHSQTHNDTVVHLKLDEIIRAVKDARNDTIDLENLNQDELDELKKYYYALATRARRESPKNSVSHRNNPA